MGFEFDGNGKYIGWSNLFNYDSAETLQASELLPLPTGKQYIKGDNNAIDITSYLQQLQNTQSDADRIKILANLLIYLNSKKSTVLTWTSLDEIGQKTLKDINIHEQTNINPSETPLVLRNIVATNIQYIVQSLRNMDKAYTPITMDTLHKSAPAQDLTVSLINPLSKFIMQEQNMVGKDVIGIAAVAEKVFFNLSYYWNEGIRSNNLKWLENLKFQQTFDRIQNRHTGVPQTVTKTALSNVNYGDNFELFTQFTNTTQYIQSRLQELIVNNVITEEDVQNNSEAYQKAIQQIQNDALDKYSANVETDDMISQLLSAATDNAKELILAKINCSSDMAKHYAYLLMLGFDIKDIVKFMTSPTVNLIKTLLQANIFDEYLPKQSISKVLGILQGNFPVQSFLNQTSFIDGEPLAWTDQILYILNKQMPTDLFELDNNVFGQKAGKTVIPKNYRNLGQLLKAYFIARTKYGFNKSLESYMGWDTTHYLSNILNSQPAQRNFYSLVNYIEFVINNVNSIPDFSSDLAEFIKIDSLANETTTLGQLLGFNQGFKTKKEEQLAALFRIQSVIPKQLANLGITKYILKDKAQTKNIIIDSYNFRNKSNPEIVNKIYDDAEALDIIEHFDIIKWAQDINYRKVTSGFYNLIKGTWNIFDVIEKVPQYNAIFKLLSTISTIERESITKARIIEDICQDLIQNHGSFLSKDDIQQISKYTDILLVKHWFDNTNYKFPINNGDSIFTHDFDTITYSGKSYMMPLNSEQNRATFKYLMEHDILSALQSGNFNGQDLSNNAFIQNLIIDTDINDKPFMRLNIDMQNINRSVNNARLFQECLNDFRKLSNITYGGAKLTDWFMIYNYYINRNMYGENRMTTLFASYAQDLNQSAITNIYKHTSNLDYFENLSKEDLDYNAADALYYMSPLISKNAEGGNNDLMVREIENGHIIIKQRSSIFDSFGNGTKIIPDKKSEESTEQTNQRYKNYIENSYITLPFYNKNSIYIQELTKKDTVLDTLKALIKKGIIEIRKENC